MKIIKTSRRLVVFESIHAVCEALQAYTYVLLIKTDKVEYLYAKDAVDLSRLTELRAHTADTELHLIKSADRFIGRIRIDGEGEEAEYMDETQCLWGTAKSFDGAYSYMWEDRGIGFRLPCHVPMGKGAYMTVRSYLDGEDFSFTDYRIVNIEAEGGAQID